MRFARELPEDSPFQPNGRRPRRMRGSSRASLAMDVDAYRAACRGSPMKRANLPGMKRGAAVVLGNVGTPQDVDVPTRALGAPEPIPTRIRVLSLAVREVPVFVLTGRPFVSHEGTRAGASSAAVRPCRSRAVTYAVFVAAVLTDHVVLPLGGGLVLAARVPRIGHDLHLIGRPPGVTERRTSAWRPTHSRRACEDLAMT